jgi:CheY-like chemotaxis protein
MARLLVVDDDAPLLSLVCDYLAAQGHKALACPDPREAPGLAESSGAQLAIVDYEMPRMKGTEVLGELRRRGALRELPVVFLSAADALTLAAQVPPDPRVRYLSKPADLEALNRLIAELLPGDWAAKR